RHDVCNRWSLPPISTLARRAARRIPLRVRRISDATDRDARYRDSAGDADDLHADSNRYRGSNSHSDPDSRPDANGKTRRTAHYQLGRYHSAARRFVRRPAHLRADRNPGLLLEPDRWWRRLLLVRRQHDGPAVRP